jgi:WhiB family redox-sensing transcriptional regulator
MQELALSAEDLELACRKDPELFFAEAPADVELAKSLCADCPIRRACLAGALERREPWGVWGGELFVRGVIVPRKRPRGRPRKDADAEAPGSGDGRPPEPTKSTVAA